MPGTRASHAFSRSLRPSALVALAAFLPALAACTVESGSTGGTTGGTPGAGTPTATATAPAAATATTASGSVPVQVFFSKSSDTNVSHVYPVNRVSPDSGVANYSLKQLIA